MNILSRNKSLERSSSSNRTFLFINACLSVSLLIAITAMVNQKERIVLIPPQIDRSVTIGWSSADGAYLKSFGLYVATLAGNITPKNAQFVVENLSTIVSPRIYPDVRLKLLSQAQSPNFIRNATATSFSPERIIFEDTTSKVFVTGPRTVETSSGSLSAGEMTYEMTIRMVEGKPVVDAINNYEGGEPRTVQWMEAHKDDPIKMKKNEN